MNKGEIGKGGGKERREEGKGEIIAEGLFV